MSMLGQMKNDVAYACGMAAPVYGVNGGTTLFDLSDVLREIDEIFNHRIRPGQDIREIAECRN
jgi:hypothetical protein